MSKIALTNVRIFDGNQILPPTTVIIEGELIQSIRKELESNIEITVIDASHDVLLPGLIDSHVHLHGPESLKQLAQYGVTTGLDMATWPPSLVASLRDLASKGGVADFRTPGLPAWAPGSGHSQVFPVTEDKLITNSEIAAKYVEARVAEGVDYIKIIADLPGFDQTILNTLVAEAHKHGKKAIAHAAHYPAFLRSLEAKCDVLTHVPTKDAIDSCICEIMIAQQAIAVPTLSMMEGIVNNLRIPGTSYSNARESVKAMHEAGIPIFAGTDCNAQPGVPAQIKHGESLHHELELLVDAGLSTLEVLRAATSLPAQYFGLSDRGIIEVGKRADILLIGGDPIADIKATRQIKRVWCKGVEVERG